MPRIETGEWRGEHSLFPRIVATRNPEAATSDGHGYYTALYRIPHTAASVLIEWDSWGLPLVVGPMPDADARRMFDVQAEADRQKPILLGGPINGQMVYRARPEVQS